jgi:serine/threonine protein kinase
MADFSPLSTIKRLASSQASPPAPAQLGRFELRKILGKGAQSVVWLGFDPRLEREVAIKQMKVGQGADARVIAQWLQEARSVSRLNHPNIVPVFEADVQEQQPYLVFEYVAGQTLAAMISQRGALPPAEAVALMLDVLDALDAAHAAGVVHRDLKPSNVLVNALGRARVMDFGIAARMDEASVGASTTTSGTPGYLAPEAAKGLPATPQVDIFSAGIVLAEMLLGKRLIAEADPLRAIYRAINEQLTLPKDLAGVDDALRAVVLRALALDPAQRHTSVKVFRDELAKWSRPVPAAQGAADGASSGSSTLDFLLRRMRHKSDFPAMSDAVVRIQGMATSETESVNSVTNEILKDVALTNKLLRLVNSVHYSRGGSISTVSRAVSLVGFNGIRNMALSLVLLEHMQDKAQAVVLKEEFLRSLMAASIASELCLSARETEEAFIGAMFHNLGRLLAQFYFSEEAQTIRTLVSSTRQPVSEATASASVLGISFEELGIGVAQVWGLPDSIQRCMRKPVGEPPNRVPADAMERQRWTSMAANDMADVMLHTDPKAVDGQLALVAKTYAKTLGVTTGDMQSATVVARKKLIDMAVAMDIVVKPGSAAAKLLKHPEDVAGSHHEQGMDSPDTLSPLELHATQTALSPEQEDSAVLAGAPPVKHVAQVLAAGIQDITNALVEEVKLSDLLRMILETMLRAMDFQRIIFCMRDPKTDTLTGRFGLGSNVDTMVKGFRVPLQPGTVDLFTAVCLKGADAMISDATEAHIVKRLPQWYCKQINAPTFLLLPVTIKGRPFGLIYADKAEKGELVLDEKELSLLQTLRNQAVMAFRQSS